ncbi:glycosyltransferase family 4 protein [Vibrio cionasavignyae]|uniref:glycosyltransferase family 4 protein n=1 Tax=Vibrio cionasavignyae TaxID=2910252 RepID=UPI003D09C1B0
MFDYLIVTHLPVFYKVNLYNRLSNYLNIHVIFIGADTNEKRSDDFNILRQSRFSYSLLHNGSFQNRNVFKTCWKLLRLMASIEFNKIIVGGWDLPEFWLSTMSSRKHNNCLSLESTILDSSINGYRGSIKRFFLSRISSVFASGQLHIDLLSSLNYSGVVKKTLGVGIVNDISASLRTNLLKDNYGRRFLYIGRLTPVKNVSALVDLFNDLPSFHLTIIGVGEDDNMLRAVAEKNIEFKGAVDNNALGAYFASHDFLLLPSLQEPWGLVVEESLNYNTPVIVSDRCGSVDLIDNGRNGLVFSPVNDSELESLITSIDQSLFMKLVEGATEYSIKQKDDCQVRQYVELI